MSVQPLLEERSTSRSPAGKYFEERKENIQRSKAEIESCIQTSFSSSAAFGSFTITDTHNTDSKMSGLALARAAQKSGVQTRGVAFQAAIIASASKKVHKTLSKLSSGIHAAPNSMEFSLDGEAISYKPPVLLMNSECYDDYAILESARAKELHDSLQNVVTLRPNKSEQHARI